MLAAALAGLALAAPAAATPVRTCAERGEGTGPTRFRPFDSGDVRLGAAIFVGLGRASKLRSGELARNGGRLPFYKAGVLVKASRIVTLSIAPESRGFARVAYDNGNRSSTGSLENHPVSVVIRACPKDQPAFSYGGVVGPATGFPGGFITDGTGIARCVGIQLRVKGKRRVYRRVVPFGAIRC